MLTVTIRIYNTFIRNIALVHGSLVNTIMRRVPGHTVTSAPQQGAGYGTQAIDIYRNPSYKWEVEEETISHEKIVHAMLSFE